MSELVPQAAVEAAARALHADNCPSRDACTEECVGSTEWERDATVAIRAAMPFVAAQALREAAEKVGVCAWPDDARLPVAAVKGLLTDWADAMKAGQ